MDDGIPSYYWALPTLPPRLMGSTIEPHVIRERELLPLHPLQFYGHPTILWDGRKFGDGGEHIFVSMTAPYCPPSDYCRAAVSILGNKKESCVPKRDYEYELFAC